MKNITEILDDREAQLKLLESCLKKVGIVYNIVKEDIKYSAPYLGFTYKTDFLSPKFKTFVNNEYIGNIYIYNLDNNSFARSIYFKAMEDEFFSVDSNNKVMYISN
jgi:hypothetical protein